MDNCKNEKVSNKLIVYQDMSGNIKNYLYSHIGEFDIFELEEEILFNSSDISDSYGRIVFLNIIDL